MNKNLIKGAEKCLSQECGDCEFGGRFLMCYERMNLHHKKRLKQAIDCCKSLDVKQEYNANADRLMTVIMTFCCLGIISQDEALDYIKKLSREEVK